jgi:hypothetical protein
LGGDCYKALVDSLAADVTPDADALAGVTVAVRRPLEAAQSPKDTSSYSAALELARIGYRPPNDAADNDGPRVYRTWVIRCAVFGRAVEFPGDAIGSYESSGTSRTFTCGCGARRIVTRCTRQTRTGDSIDADAT